MQWVMCPAQGCRKSVRVHHAAPDIALVELMWHFFNGHPELDSLALLDSTDEIKV